MKRFFTLLLSISLMAVDINNDEELQIALISSLRIHGVGITPPTQLALDLLGDITLSTRLFTLPGPPPDRLAPSFPFLAPVGSFTSFQENSFSSALSTVIRAPADSRVCINGVGTYRGFIVRGGVNNSIERITFKNLIAKGGDGSLGGSGSGLGGAIAFLGEVGGRGTVLTDVSFVNCRAIGGRSNPSRNYRGGASINIESNGAGGSGIGGFAFPGGSRAGGGFARNAMSDTGGLDFRSNESGGSVVGLGSPVTAYAAENGDRTVTLRGVSVMVAGGGAGSDTTTFNSLSLIGGGNGGFGSGAGARTSTTYSSLSRTPPSVGANEARGGFGGGGGYGDGIVGGIGGFAAGGGGSTISGGRGGVGGGSGGRFGGDAAGFGGAFFMYGTSNVTCLGNISFENNFASGSVTPILDIEGTDGMINIRRNRVYGHDIFLMTGAMLTFDVPINTNVVVPNPIGGDLGSAFYDSHPSTAVFPEVGVNDDQADSLFALRKIGEGVLFLNGDNNYSTITLVEAGTLSIDGSLKSDVQVRSGATLRGIFTIYRSGALDVNGSPILDSNSMRVSNSIGSLALRGGSTLEVQSDYDRSVELEGTFSHLGNASVIVEIDPSNDPDRVFLRANSIFFENSSTAMLEARLLDGNYIAGRRFRVFEFELIGQDYLTATTSGPNSDLDISYTGSAVVINTTRLFRNLVSGSKLTQSLTKGIAQNSVAVENASIRFQRYIEIVGKNSPTLERDLLQFTPWQYGSINWIHLRDLNLFTSYISSRCYERFFVLHNPELESFASALVDTIEQYKKGFVYPFKGVSSGGVYGIDYRKPHSLLGACFGYRRSYINWENNQINPSSTRTQANMHSYFGVLYGATLAKKLFVDYSITAGSLVYAGERLFHLNEDRKIFQATFTSPFVATHLCIGTFVSSSRCPTRVAQFSKDKDSDFFDVALQPFITFNYSFLNKRSFSETPEEEVSFILKQKHHHNFTAECGLNVLSEKKFHKVNTLWQVGCSILSEFTPYRQYEEFLLRPLSSFIDAPTYNNDFWNFSFFVSFRIFTSKTTALSVRYRQILQPRVYVHSGQIQISFAI